VNLFTRKSRRAKDDPEEPAEHASEPEEDEASPPPAERSLLARARQRLHSQKDDDPQRWRSGWHAQLLPAEIADQAQARRARRLTVAASITFVLLLSLAHTSQLLLNQQANQRVEDAQAALNGVESETADLSAAADLERLLSNSRSLTDVVFANKNDPGALLGTVVAAAAAEGATFDTVTLTVDTDGDNALPLDGGGQPLGTFTARGQTTSTVAVFELADRLEQLPVAAAVNIDSYSAAGESASFAISGQITDATRLAATNGTEGQN